MPSSRPCGHDLQVYNPYDLVVVKKADVDPHYFYTITQTGVTHMWGGLVYELVPHYEWIRDAELYSVLKKLVLFAKRPLFTVRVSYQEWLQWSRIPVCTAV